MGEGAAAKPPLNSSSSPVLTFQPPGTHKPFAPQGEKVPEGRMRGGGKQRVSDSELHKGSRQGR